MNEAPHPRREPGWLDHPGLSLLIAATWLLLQQSIALGQLLLAAALGLALPRLLSAFLPKTARPARPGVAIALAGRVLVDVVAANFAVARLALAPGSDPQPAWIDVPLVLRDPMARVLLASIVSSTPGTVSCAIDEAGGRLLVHALDCDDPSALVEQIRQRYESALKEIFE